ncbi:phytoene/squalene synthase family protein [Demequina lignilytica]|uniref:Squalene/phytoene synthase family protein n=1 Tax=Demequina lignilytica TaxID=3051663 RepID=A0AB35MHX3_9MICO|nr:squalene/phytoene synthase family protein [Demequina sp. SYSU T0a273]MDN4483417.1 squalene/phytoene synthase family protein [Demequina sp. SYSU T0a273]
MSQARRRVHLDNATSLALYDEAARAAAAQVIARYSTSFGLGTRLLPRAMRHHIEAVYAMVRVADEVVDTYRGDDAGDLLDAFADEVHAAMARGFSADLVAHAFATTAREVGIARAQTEPFFASMRMDLATAEHDAESLATYIYGSAEVVGEMCLAVFVNTGQGPRPLEPRVSEGARRLGAAYQKVNFLRDLGSDVEQLGRAYFPGVTAESLTDARLAELVADCRADMDAARACLPDLPRRARVAVATTLDIYDRLLAQIASTPAAELAGRRIRVANPVKLGLAARNVVPFGSAAGARA